MFHKTAVPHSVPAGHYVAADPTYLFNGEVGDANWGVLLSILDAQDRKNLYGVPVALADEDDVLAMLAVETEDGDGVFPLKFHGDTYPMPVDSGTLAIVRSDAVEDQAVLKRAIIRGLARDLGQLPQSPLTWTNYALTVGDRSHPVVELDGRSGADNSLF